MNFNTSLFLLLFVFSVPIAFDGNILLVCSTFLLILVDLAIAYVLLTPVPKLRYEQVFYFSAWWAICYSSASLIFSQIDSDISRFCFLEDLLALVLVFKCLYSRFSYQSMVYCSLCYQVTWIFNLVVFLNSSETDLVYLGFLLALYLDCCLLRKMISRIKWIPLLYLDCTWKPWKRRSGFFYFIFELHSYTDSRWCDFSILLELQGRRLSLEITRK